MGWLWSDTPSTAPKEQWKQQKDFVPDSKAMQETPTTSNPAAASTREKEPADPELADFLKAIEAESSPSQKKPVYVRRPKSQTSSSSTQDNQVSSHLPISEQLLPTTMSCREAFDSAFYCNSLGGQWNAVYRSGNMRKCSDHWNDFWFCMRTRTYGREAKEKAIRDHFREKERLKYHGEGEDFIGGTGRSSEDVWKSRERLVETGTEMRKEWPVMEGGVGPVESDVGGSFGANS